MEAARGNGYVPVRGLPVMMMMMGVFSAALAEGRNRDEHEPPTVLFLHAKFQPRNRHLLSYRFTYNRPASRLPTQPISSG